MEQEQQEMPVTITDKRGQKKDMPTAEELLADNDPPGDPTEFERQLAEEKERLAAWEAMTDEERQEVLAQQANDINAVPFQGGGMQAPPDEHAGKKQVLTMFTVVVHNDGTAVASDDLDLSKFEAQFPVDGNMIYRALCEIKKDIESTDAATMVLQFMNTHAAMVAQQQQAQALAQGLQMRGQQPPPRGRRH
jgi:hypothetical protein